MTSSLLLLCCDFDGTLASIADHPAAARLSLRTRRLLQQLSRRRDVRVVLVSGRALSDLKGLVRLRGLWYVGNHGLELQGPAVRFVHPGARASRPVLARVAEAIRSALRPIPGAWVEDKGLSLSVHWRRVSSSARRRVHRLINAASAPFVRVGAVKLRRGKCVAEVLPPVRWDKGAALKWLVPRLCPARHPRPQVIYLGDDRTDESAFRAARKLGGCAVMVGRIRRRSAAQCWLRDPNEVRAWLTRLAKGRPWNLS